MVFKVLKTYLPYIKKYQFILYENVILHKNTISWVILVISHDISVFFLLFLCSSYWFEVGGAQLEKGDITYFHAPIRIQQQHTHISLTKNIYV